MFEQVPFAPKRGESVEQSAVVTKLKSVAEAFVKTQEARQSADYDNSRIWSRIDVYEHIWDVQEAITAWAQIRHKEVAQDYLFELLGGR